VVQGDGPGDLPEKADHAAVTPAQVEEKSSRKCDYCEKDATQKIDFSGIECYECDTPTGTSVAYVCGNKCYKKNSIWELFEDGEYMHEDGCNNCGRKIFGDGKYTKEMIG
jgi:DNA-directed RNA polymerase subunit RPC12/RpoP